MFVSANAGSYPPRHPVTVQDSDTKSALTGPEQQGDVRSRDDKNDKGMDLSKTSRNQSAGNAVTAENELDQAEIRQLRELRSRDREVRAHEQAHATVAGALAKGGASFSFQRGPDGQLYAIGGEVKIDTSALAGDAQSTAQKAQQIRRAALAPAQPSSQDRAVAAQAATMEIQARAEIAKETAAETGTGLADQSRAETTVKNDGSGSSQDSVETGNRPPAALSRVASLEERLSRTFDTGDTPDRSGQSLNISV